MKHCLLFQYIIVSIIIMNIIGLSLSNSVGSGLSFAYVC